MARKGERKRELVQPNGDKRYVRRDAQGEFTNDQVEVGRSLSKDRQQHARTVSKRGEGDRGDRSR